MVKCHADLYIATTVCNMTATAIHLKHSVC